MKTRWVDLRDSGAESRAVGKYAAKTYTGADGTIVQVGQQITKNMADRLIENGFVNIEIHNTPPTELEDAEFFSKLSGADLTTAEAFVATLRKKYPFLQIQPLEPYISMVPHFLVSLFKDDKTKVVSLVHEGLSNALAIAQLLHKHHYNPEALGYILVEVGFLHSNAGFEPLLFWELSHKEAPRSLFIEKKAARDSCHGANCSSGDR